MVNVRLERDWTDSDGTAYRAGQTVDVTVGTLAALEAEGTVAELGNGGSGHDGGPGDGAGSGNGGRDDSGDGTESWIEPTGDDGTESWIEPTGGDRDG